MERKAKFNMNLAKIMGAVYLLRAFCFTFADLLSLTGKMLAPAWGFMLSVKYAIGILTKKNAITKSGFYCFLSIKKTSLVARLIVVVFSGFSKNTFFIND